jgi:hypothetical protein
MNSTAGLDKNRAGGKNGLNYFRLQTWVIEFLKTKSDLRVNNRFQSPKNIFRRKEGKNPKLKF